MYTFVTRGVKYQDEALPSASIEVEVRCPSFSFPVFLQKVRGRRLGVSCMSLLVVCSRKKTILKVLQTCQGHSWTIPDPLGIIPRPYRHETIKEMT